MHFAGNTGHTAKAAELVFAGPVLRAAVGIAAQHVCALLRHKSSQQRSADSGEFYRAFGANAIVPQPV